MLAISIALKSSKILLLAIKNSEREISGGVWEEEKIRRGVEKKFG